MRRFSPNQFKALSDFFNTVAAAWFTGGIVAPFFSKVLSAEKLATSIAGVVYSYVFLNLSLFFVKGTDR